MLLKLLPGLFLLFAAQSVLPQSDVPEPLGHNLYRLEGTDGPSGIHYLKLIETLPGSSAEAAPESQPRFTIECQEHAGKLSLLWLVRFDGSPDFTFQRPIVSTRENPYPIQNPSLELKMRFEGYMRSQEFKRQWEILPTGEFRYRNSGFRSSNMDDPAYFLRWLNSLPNLRIGYAKPTPGKPAELVFPLQPLLAEFKKAALCGQ